MAIYGVLRLELGLVACAQYATITVLVEMTRRTTGQPGGGIETSQATTSCDGRSGLIVLRLVQMREAAETSRVDWRGWKQLLVTAGILVLLVLRNVSFLSSEDRQGGLVDRKLPAEPFQATHRLLSGWSLRAVCINHFCQPCSTRFPEGPEWSSNGFKLGNQPNPRLTPLLLAVLDIESDTDSQPPAPAAEYPQRSPHG
jgi:hypothetical protein